MRRVVVEDGDSHVRRRLCVELDSTVPSRTFNAANNVVVPTSPSTTTATHLALFVDTEDQGLFRIH